MRVESLTEKPSPQNSLDEIQATLGLTKRELGQVFQVSPRTINRWQRRIPQGRTEEITEALAAIGKLKEFFKPDCLPDVIRKPAPAFGGMSAFGVILEEGIEGLKRVTDTYDEALYFQPD